MARALTATGRFRLAAVHGTEAPEFLRGVPIRNDFEDLIADPALPLVIIASGPMREEHLRRALQSERHVLCASPCATKPDLAYEAAVIQTDVKVVLLPLRPDGLHPVWPALRERLGASPIRLIEWRQHRPAVGWFDGWDVLRQIGGEIVELSGFAVDPDWTPDHPLLLHGRFESEALFQVTRLPAPTLGDSLTVYFADGEIRCTRSHDRWHLDGQEVPSDPWGLLAEQVRASLGGANPSGLAWQDEIRGLELDLELRRSIERRRAGTLEYHSVDGDAGPKGTLTLIGCGMIWVILLIMGISIWFPHALWAIVPLILGFLGLLGLKWLGERR